MFHHCQIKPAQIEDIPLILSLIKELASYEQSSHAVEATTELLTQSLFFEPRRAEVILCYLNSEVVGFAIFLYNFSSYLGRAGIYIEDIYVKSEARGQGLGKKMLTYIAKIAQEKNCQRIEWSMLKWNKAAIGFYEHLGAEQLEERVNYRLTTAASVKLAQVD